MKIFLNTAMSNYEGDVADDSVLWTYREDETEWRPLMAQGHPVSWDEFTGDPRKWLKHAGFDESHCRVWNCETEAYESIDVWLGERSELAGWWVFVWARRPSWCRADLRANPRGDGDVCSTGWPYGDEAEARAAYAGLEHRGQWFELANDGATVEERENPGWDQAAADREDREYAELCAAEARVLYPDTGE